MKSKKTQISLLIITFIVCFSPLLSSAQDVNQASQYGTGGPNGPSITGGTVANPSGCTSGKQIPDFNEKECGWGDLVALFQRVMAYLIFIGTTLCAISVAYAGFLYMTSAGNTGQIEKAHHVFTYTIIGLLFIWGGWLLVATILKTLGVGTDFSLVGGFNSVGN